MASKQRTDIGKCCFVNRTKTVEPTACRGAGECHLYIMYVFRKRVRNVIIREEK
jgi:hypothetical protein